MSPATDVTGQDLNSEIVVCGATASGAIAAIAAADEGADVLLIGPGRNVGGMVTGGLSHNDYGDRTVIGGMALEFYQKVADYYNKPLYYWRGPEPHVGEKIFRDWLGQAGVDLLFEKRVMDVLVQDGRIQHITLSDGSTVKGKVFIDASYEGDLMARAGISYTVGREGVNEFNESWAGRRAILPDGHQMLPSVSPFRNENTRELLPLINPVPTGKAFRRRVTLYYTGSGTQAFLQRWQRLVRPILRRQDGFAVTSERLRAEFQRYGLDPSIIPLSIEVAHYPFTGHPDWPPLILWVNSLETGSNPGMALRALARLRQSRPEARLLMVGHGPAAIEVKSLAAELGVAGSVAYRPFLPFSRLRQVMQTASVAWNTNSADSFPVSLLEAAASGTVVVSTEVGGIEEFLHDGVDALLVEVDDHEALAAATLQALRRPILSDGLAQNARLAVHNCDWEQTRGKMARLFGWRAGLSPWLGEGEEAEPPPAGVGSLELETMGLRGRAEFLRTHEPPVNVDLPAEEVPPNQR